MFTGSKAPWHLEDFRVFGAPTYMLEKRLQDGDSMAKWKACSWLGIYVGLSLAHAGNVPVIYNMIMTHVTPQFHVVYDDQSTSASRPISSMSDGFYKTLYEKAFWSFKPEGEGVHDDLYHFKSYWSEPSLSTRANKRFKSHDTPISESKGHKNTVPNNPLVNSNYNNELNDTKAAAAQNQTANQAANTHMQKPAPKLNLVQVNNCSLTLQAWKEANGVNATVYHIPQDTWNNADDSNILSPGNPSILLSYAHLVTLDPSKQSQRNVASNKEDVLTQSQMLKHLTVSASFNLRVMKLQDLKSLM
jgi:hypothetical protein